MRVFRRAVAVLAALAIGGVIAAPAASAATGDCDKGYMCIFIHLDFTGTMRGFSNARLSWEGYALNNEATSVSANGGSCSRSYYYDRGDWSTAGDYFYLNSQTLVGHHYRDPDLRNGAGYGTWAAKDANDKISSAQFSSCR